MPACSRYDHWSKSLPARHKITGETFGLVTIVAELGTDRNGRSLWLARCACGVEELFSQQRLMHTKLARCTVCVKKSQREHGDTISKIRKPEAAPASIPMSLSEIHRLEKCAQLRRGNSKKVRRKFRFAILNQEQRAIAENSKRMAIPSATLFAIILQRSGLLNGTTKHSLRNRLLKTAERRRAGEYNNLYATTISLADTEWVFLKDAATNLSMPVSRLILSSVEQAGLMVHLATVDGLGSGLIGHSQKMTVAARATAEKKAVGQRS